MKTIALTLLSISWLCTNSQTYAIKNYDISIWEDLKHQKLHVVNEIDGESSYDLSLAKALNENWNFNSLEFISYDQFEEMQRMEHHFFLVSEAVYKNQLTNSLDSISHIHLIKGYRFGAKPGDFGRFPLLASVKVGEIDRKTYLPIMVKHLNKKIDDITSGRIKSFNDNSRLINKKKKYLKDFTIYVHEKDLNNKIKSIEDIKMYYKGPIEVVNQKQLNEIIKTDKECNIVFAVGSASKFYLHVYNNKTGEEYYNSHNYISKRWPRGLISHHLKKWN